MLAAVMSKVKEHTLGCSSSPKLCKPVVKQLGGALSSATGIVLAYNNSEEDQPYSVRSREGMLIYVLNHKGRPFPHNKTRINLEKGKVRKRILVEKILDRKED